MSNKSLKIPRVTRAAKIHHMRHELTRAKAKERVLALAESAKKITSQTNHVIYPNITRYANSWDYWFAGGCTDKQLVKLYDHLYIKAPKLLSKASDIFLSKKSDAAWKSRKYFVKRFNRIHTYLSYIANSSIRVGHINRHLKSPIQAENTKAVEEQKPTESKQEQKIVFPQTSFADVDKDLQKKVAAVQRLWEIAIEQKSDADNEFFLEQVVLSYLPESYHLYLNFTHATIDMRKQAKKIFMDQLKMIETKIQSIIDYNAANSITALASQSNFLKEKLEKKDSSLTLVGEKANV